MIVFKSRAFKELYRMGGCKDMMHHSPVNRLSIYLCALLPMTVAREDWPKFFDQLPGLRDSEWAEILEHMDAFFSLEIHTNAGSAYLNKRYDWINGLDTIRAFS
jgi:hypothetical protein